MPALSFKPEWVRPLLSEAKQQTTRHPAPAGKPPRIKLGDLCYIYNSQRVKISTKPLWTTTSQGKKMILQKLIDDRYPLTPALQEIRGLHPSDIREYYVHFLGVVEISEMYEIMPSEMADSELDAWAFGDGFAGFDEGDVWFVRHHSDTWMNQRWAVCRWDGWVERYFEVKHD